MSNRRARIIPFQGEDGQFYWHLRDTNGEIIAHGEGYESADGVLEGIANLMRTFAASAVVDVEPLTLGEDGETRHYRQAEEA